MTNAELESFYSNARIGDSIAFQPNHPSLFYSMEADGIVVLDNEDGDIDEDKAMEDILEAGGDDFTFEDGCVEITTEPNDAAAVGEALAGMGYKVLSAEPAKVPATYTTLTDEDHIKKMGLLLDTLDDNDDVQNVWHNWEEWDFGLTKPFA